MHWNNLKHIPAVLTVMTPFPFTVNADDSAAVASQMMAEHAIRHLPVIERGQLIGVISDRDIRRALLGSGSPDAETLRVGDICALEVYVIDIGERLDSVLLHMSETHIGSALVMKEDRLAGIFTMTDACHHFGELLRSRFPLSEGGDDVA